MQEKSTVDFLQDVPAGKEHDTNYVRGGWTKFVVSDEDSDEIAVYGINIASTATTFRSDGAYTLRIAEWDQIPTDGKLTDQSAIQLIVTVKKGVVYDGMKQKSTYTITNWSSQPLTGDAAIDEIKETDTTRNRVNNVWDWFENFWSNLMKRKEDHHFKSPIHFPKGSRRRNFH